MANIGRNDPCPCGSGRKYKHCCLQHADANRVLRARLRAAESRIVPALLAFALEGWGETFLEDAWKEFVLWSDDVPESLSDDPDFYPLFLPWFLFTYMADAHEEDAPEDLPTAPIGRVYLEEHDDLEDLDRCLVESACDGGFSFHVVRRVAGETIELKDILTGAAIRVLEQSGAGSVSPGDILFALPVAAGGGAILLGCATHIIPPSWHNRIIDFREEMWTETRPTPDALAAFDFEIRDFYFEIAEAIYNPAPPTLTNTDGEPLEPTTLTYDLRCSADEAFDAFKRASSHDESSLRVEKDDVEWNEDGTVARATARWLNDKETLLGTVTIERGVLRAEVNSLARSARITEEIALQLGDRVALVDSRTLSAEELIAEAAEEASADEAALAVEAFDPEAAAAVMAKHWETWVEEPVPALANQTPREAATTALGRERLEALLAEYRWRDERLPQHLRMDIGTLRRQLKLEPD